MGFSAMVAIRLPLMLLTVVGSGGCPGEAERRQLSEANAQLDKCQKQLSEANAQLDEREVALFRYAYENDTITAVFHGKQALEICELQAAEHHRLVPSSNFYCRRLAPKH